MNARWPWPGDTLEDRARRVALSYRHILEQIRAGRLYDIGAAIDAVDARWTELGAGWIKPTRSPATQGEWLTAREVAGRFHRSIQWPHVLSSRGHVESRMLGDRRVFNMNDVVAYRNSAATA